MTNDHVTVTENSDHNILTHDESIDVSAFDALEIDSSQKDWFARIAQEAKLSQEQVNIVIEQCNQLKDVPTDADHDDLSAPAYNAVNELKSKYGSDFEKHVDRARQAASNLGVTRDTMIALEENIGSDTLFELLSNMGSQLADPPFVTSPDGAVVNHDNSLHKLMADHNFVERYLNGEKNAFEQVRELYQHS